MVADGHVRVDNNAISSTKKIINKGLIYAKQGMTFNVEQLYNYCSILSSKEILGLGKKLFNLGTIFGENDVKFIYRDYLINNNDGIIASGNDLNLMRHDHNKSIDVDDLQQSSLINQGKVIATKKLSVFNLYNNAGIITNEINGLLKAEAIVLGGDQFINDGNVIGKQQLEMTLSCENGRWYNTSTGNVHTQNLNCVLDQLYNEGAIHAQQEIIALLATLENQLKGHIISDANMRLTTLKRLTNDWLIKAKDELNIYGKSIAISEEGRLSANHLLLNGEQLVSDGKIITTESCDIVAKFFDNLANGQVIAAEQLKLIIEEQLNNRGSLQAKIANIGSANQVNNSSSGSIYSEKLTLSALQVENAGQIISLQEVNLLAINNFNQTATAKIIANLGLINITGTDLKLSGQLAAKSIALMGWLKTTVNPDAKIISDEIVFTGNSAVNAGQITAAKTLQIDVYNQMEQTNTGSMVASEIAVKSNNIKNAGIILGTTKVAIEASTLINLYNAVIESASAITVDAAQLRNAGIVKAYGELQLKLLYCLENLQSGNISSVQDLIIDVCGIIKNLGLISSESLALIKFGDVLENYDTGVIQAKEFSLVGGWQIDNFGIIWGNEHLKLIASAINNYQTGKTSSEQALELVSNTLVNNGEISADYIYVFIQNILQNYQDSTITATEALSLVGAKLIVNSGDITSAKIVDVKAIQVLENLKSGAITAATGLTAMAELLVANHGQMAANNIRLAASKLLLNGQLFSEKLSGKAEIITGDGTIEGGVTDLTADLVELDGKLKAASLHIEAKNYLHLLKNGEITCEEASKLLSTAGFVNLGKILSSDQLAIIAKDLFHDLTGTIDARRDLYLKAINLYLDGDYKASKDLFVLVENQFEYNTATLMANGELNLILKNGTQIKHPINTPGGLKIEFLTKNGTWYNEQQLKAGSNLILDVPGFIFVNGKSSNEALLQANNTLKIYAEQLDTAKGQLKAKDYDVHTRSDININQSSNIIGDSGVFHSEAGNIEQQGQLKFKENAAIIASKQYGKKDGEKEGIIANDSTSRNIDSVRGANGKVNIGGTIQASKIAVVADNKITVTGTVEAELDNFIESLFDDVEVKSIMARRGNNEKFNDVIISQARIAAKNLLQIYAGKNVIFQGIETESGEAGTHIQALADFLDIPITLVRQHVEHFHSKRKNGTICDTYVSHHTSVHKSKKDFNTKAGSSSTLYAPTIEAETATINSVNGDTVIMNVTDSHEHKEDLKGKKRQWHGGTKKTSLNFALGKGTSRGANLKITKELRVSGKNI